MLGPNDRLWWTQNGIMQNISFRPQTFDQPSLKHRITYKETTATGANIYCPTLEDWAALDYAAIPKTAATQVLKCRSNPFVSLATRHFPVELTLNIIPITHRSDQSLEAKISSDHSTGDYRSNLDSALQAKFKSWTSQSWKSSFPTCNFHWWQLYPW